jgi:flagellar biosynthesis/type III secretory pathway protein FliH
MKEEIKKRQEKVEKNVLEYNGNWHKKGKDGNCEEFTIVDLREIIEQTYKQAYEKGFIDGSELTGRIAEEEIVELKNKVSKEFDKKHKDPFKQGYEKGYKQGKEDIVEKLRKEASNLEDGIRESGGSKKEIEDVFDNFYFTLSKLNQ